MSYWISLRDKKTGEALEVPSFTEGGTYAVGGSCEADLNVTYNYCKFFNFKGLHGKGAKKTIEELGVAVMALGTERDPDYWKATEGNAGYTVNILLGWAKQHPTGIWNVN